MTQTGTLIQVDDPIHGTSKNGKDWAKQQAVMEIPGRYPKKLAFDVWGDVNIDGFRLEVGETITISIDLESNEHNGKWYTRVKCWKVDRGQQQQTHQSPVQNTATPTQSVDQPVTDDDLPF